MVATESIMNEVNDLEDRVYGDSPVAVEKAKADQNGNIIDEYYATAKSVEDLTDLIGSVDDGGILMELNNVENKLNLLGDDADSRDVNTRIADALADAKKDSADKAAVVLSEAQKYADGLATNYATAAQGQKADSALQEVVANDVADKPSGIKVTEKNKIEVDDTIVWVFDCGDSTVE